MTAPPHTRGECDWCRWPLGAVAEEWNCGIGHPGCVAFAESVVFPDGPGPVYVHRRRFHRDDLDGFLYRLGPAAVAVGIDAQKLARAVEEAGHV